MRALKVIFALIAGAIAVVVGLFAAVAIAVVSLVLMLVGRGRGRVAAPRGFRFGVGTNPPRPRTAETRDTGDIIEVNATEVSPAADIPALIAPTRSPDPAR